MEPELIGELERELHQALERRPAPPALKRRILDQRRREHDASRHRRIVLWQRLAAAFTLVVVLAGALLWRNAEQRRKGEQAREQVLTALRITSRALNQMESQLAASGRSNQE